MSNPSLNHPEHFPFSPFGFPGPLNRPRDLSPPRDHNRPRSASPPRDHRPPPPLSPCNSCSSGPRLFQ